MNLHVLEKDAQTLSQCLSMELVCEGSLVGWSSWSLYAILTLRIRDIADIYATLDAILFYSS